MSLLNIYDRLNRLTQVTSAGIGNQYYSYDNLGNRITRRGNLSENYSISADSNQLTKVTRNGLTRSFSYDANGNVISENNFNNATITYGYNASNRMTSRGSTTYRYNGLGQRNYKKVGSSTTHFVYGPGSLLLAEGANKQYIYFQGKVVGYILNNQLYYVHNDHLGRPEVITNNSRAKVWRAKLEPFTRTVTSSSIGGFNIGFPGQYWDEEKGSYYNMFRDYDPETGRYLQNYEGQSLIIFYEGYNYGNLTGKSINGIRYSWFDYGDSGSLYTESKHADNHYKYQISYSAFRATVTNPLGHQTHYNFSNIGGSRKLTSKSSVGTSYCPSANASISYDSQGRKASETDWRGTTTKYTYNSSEQLSKKVVASGTSDERTYHYQIINKL